MHRDLLTEECSGLLLGHACALQLHSRSSQKARSTLFICNSVHYGHVLLDHKHMSLNRRTATLMPNGKYFTSEVSAQMTSRPEHVLL